MICPNYKNNEVKEQFNEIIESLGGRPLTDEEFRSSDLRNQRQGVDYSAMEAAYKIWHRNNGNPIDAAPNGKPSILFLTLLNHFNGDRKAAIEAKTKVYSDEFINWFGDWINDSENASKVVDENGEPLVVYHNSQTKDITVFKPNVGNAIFFADAIAQKYVEGFERGDYNYAVFLNIKNPHTESYEASFIDEEDGVDGVFVSGEVEEGIGHAAIVKDPNKIKSATDNNGDFSTTNNGIYQISTVKTVIDKLVPKFRPYRPRIYKIDKSNYVEQIRRFYYNLLGIDLDIDYFDDIELIKDKINHFLYNTVSQEIESKLIKLREKYSKIEYRATEQYINNLKTFLLRKDLSAISEYDEQTLSIIKKCFPNLFRAKTQSKLNSAFGYYIHAINQKDNVYKNIYTIVNQRNIYKIKLNNSIQKLLAVQRFLNRYPDSREQIRNKLFSELDRYKEYSDFYTGLSGTQWEKGNEINDDVWEKAKVKSKQDIDFVSSIIQKGKIYSAKDVLSYLRQYPEYKQLCDIIIRSLKKQGDINIFGISDNTRDYGGLYNSVDNAVYINTSSDLYKTDPIHTILHELIHGISIFYIGDNPELVESIETFRKYVEDYWRKGIPPAFQWIEVSPYGISDKEKGPEVNAGEFVAEFMSNKEFLELLKETPAMDEQEFSSLFEQFLHWILGVLGIKKQDTAYDQIKPVVESIIDAQYAIYNNIPTLQELDQTRYTPSGDILLISQDSLLYEEEDEKNQRDFLYQKNSTDYSTEYHDIRDYLKENGIEKTELRKLKSITEPLNSGTKSIKKMRKRLEDANVDPKLIDAIIDAVEQNPNLANLQPFIIYKLLNRLRNDSIAKDYNEQIKKKVDKKLEERLMEFLKPFGVDVIEDGLAEEYGVKGIYDILNKLIHVAKNRNRATLTEEAAHAIVRLLGASVSNKEENREYTLLYNLIQSTSIYKLVYEQYKDTYTKEDEDGNVVPDINKIKEEAIGQALAVAINRKWEELNEEKSFWQQLKKWFNDILNKWNDFELKFNKYLLPEDEAIKQGTIEDPQYIDINKILDDIAHDVLSNNYERFNKVNSEGYELQSYSKTLAEQTKKDGGLAVEFMRFFTTLGNSISGSLSYRLLGTVYRKGVDSLHDIDMRVPASAHGINLDEFIPRVSGWMVGPSVAAEYPYFLLILNEYPEMRILSAYEGLNDTAVVSMIYSKDTSLSKRFIELPPNMNYKQRLDTFTEKEQSLIYLFDFFLDRGEIDTIHDDEYNINLDPYQVSFDAKLKIGRAKDIYDYLMFKLYKKYKSDVLSDKEHLLFLKSPQQAEQETKDAINKASKRLDNLYDTYSKMRNKTTTQQKILNEIFELRLKVKKAQDYSIIADVIDFAISKLGVRDSSAIDVRPTDTNTVWGWLYTEDKKDNNFADVTPAQLMDAYRNMIKFHSDLFKDKSAIFNSEIIENGAPFVSHTTLKYNREKLKDLQDSFSLINLLWTKAMIAVTDRIVEDIIDEEVDVNDRLKQNMKEVAKDYLHKNQMHGDVDDVTAWMFNYGQVPHPIIKQAFHLILYAETMTLQELHPEATKLSQLYRKYDSITKNLHPNWQTLMMEKDKNGKYTGNFIRDINYGQYEQDLKDFLEKLSAKFEKDYGHTYIEDESGFIVNSVTGELALDEEWNGYDEPIYVKYLKEVYKWKCEHANLRYTYDYYYERLSKPYDGDEDPNTPGLHIAGHGLSPKTLARYDYLLTNINYYLDLCIGKDGYSHPENLSPEEQQKLDEYKLRLDDLRNPYTDTGEFKPEEEKRIAFEIRAWERWLSQQLSSEVDLEGFLQAEQEIKLKSILENNPKLYTDFIKYNATFGINPNFIDLTIGMFDKVLENSIPLVKARILKAANESLLKTPKGMTRDFRRMENNIQFWLKCKEIDLIIEDNKVKQSKNFADAYSRNFYNKMLYYQDINGNYFDIFGHQINDPDNSNSTYPTMTWFNYIVNKYVDLAKNTGTIPGLLDANGNPANFSGYTDELIYDFVYSMFTYTTVYENEDGEEVQEDKPLSIFSMMYPIPDSFVNVHTGLTEPTLTTIPTNKFRNRKNNVYTNFINNDYDKLANIAEQPKRYDEFGNKLYDNSENYNNMRKHCGELYDALTEAMKNHQKDYGASGTIFNYRLPQIEAKTAAILSRCLSNGFKNTGLMLLNALTTILENDIDMKQSDQYLFDLENHIEHHIPLRYIRKLKDPNSIGTDITGNVILFIEMALNYKNKQGVLDQLELLKTALEDESQRVFSNTTSKNIYDSMMAKHVYGEQWHKSNLPPSIAEVIAKKSIRLGLVLETTHMLGFNILSMSTGFFDSIVRQMRESLMFKYMTPWDLTKSIAETMFRLPLILANIGNPVPNNKISAMMQINGLSKDPYKTYSHMNRGRLRKVASNLLMGGFSALDYCTQAITMNAFYKDCMFYDGDVIEKGFYSRDAFMRAMRDKGVGFALRKIERMRCHVTLWDVYKYDSENHTVYVDPKYDLYVTDKIIVRMRTKSMQRGALYNGMNPDNDIAKYRLSIWLSIVFAMRGWLVLQVQHLFAGGDETSVRQYREEEIKEFREYGLFGKKRKVVLRAKLTDEQRANRMAWNYETGVPMDEIYKGIFRSFGTVWRLICRIIKFGPKEGWNKVKFSEVEKYAWRDAIISLLCLVLSMYTWIPVHEWAEKVKPVKNRKQAGVRTLNTKGLPILDITDIPRFFEEEYLGRELYKMLIDDVWFRVIESQLAGIDPATVGEIVNSVTALKNGVESHVQIFNLFLDVMGLSGKDPNGIIKNSSSYKYYTRKERFLYRFNPITKNLHSGFTYWGLRLNEKFYLDTYGYLYKWIGYDYGWKNKNSNQNQDINPITGKPMRKQGSSGSSSPW